MEGAVLERLPTPQELARWRMGEKMRPEDNWAKAMRETRTVMRLIVVFIDKSQLRGKGRDNLFATLVKNDLVKEMI